MNTGLRLDWLSISIEGDFRFIGVVDDDEGENIPGIKMYYYGKEYDGFRLYVQGDYNDSYPVGQIVFKHWVLWGQKYDYILKTIEWVSNFVGFKGYHVTRVDLSVLINRDMIGNISEFLSLCNGRCKKVKYIANRDNEVETVYIGSRSRLLIRIYDKYKELRDNNNKDYVLNELIKMGYDKCYNVEYELRRDWLRGFGIESMGDLFGYLDSGDLWKYLTRDYFILKNKKGEIVDKWAEVMGVEFLNNGKAYEEFIDYMVASIDKKRIYNAVGGMIKRLKRIEEDNVIRFKINKILDEVYNYGEEEEKRFKVRRKDTV